MAWHDFPEQDPYEYRLVGAGRRQRRYEVYRYGLRLGVIEAGRQNTDTPIRGTRLIRPGKGKPAFFIVGDRGYFPYDRRRDAAAELERRR